MKYRPRSSTVISWKGTSLVAFTRKAEMYHTEHVEREQNEETQTVVAEWAEMYLTL